MNQLSEKCGEREVSVHKFIHWLNVKNTQVKFLNQWFHQVSKNTVDFNQSA